MLKTCKTLFMYCGIAAGVGFMEYALLIGLQSTLRGYPVNTGQAVLTGSVYAVAGFVILGPLLFATRKSGLVFPAVIYLLLGLAVSLVATAAATDLTWGFRLQAVGLIVGGLAGHFCLTAIAIRFMLKDQEGA